MIATHAKCWALRRTGYQATSDWLRWIPTLRSLCSRLLEFAIIYDPCGLYLYFLLLCHASLSARSFYLFKPPCLCELPHLYRPPTNLLIPDTKPNKAAWYGRLIDNPGISHRAFFILLHAYIVSLHAFSMRLHSWGRSIPLAVYMNPSFPCGKLRTTILWIPSLHKTDPYASSF